MGKFMKKRIMPWLLSAVLMAGMTGAPVCADGAERQTGGLCEYHPVHTGDCGYSEGAPCIHEHTDECYIQVEECVHEHTEECYPEVYGTEAEVEFFDISAAEPAACTHVCSEASGCVTKVLDCPHERGQHDDSCGYRASASCDYFCEMCANGENFAEGNEAGVFESVTQVCICGELCTENSVNWDCPLCGIEGDDQTQCRGKQPDNVLMRKIAAWEWIDENEYLTDGQLAMPGVSINHQADFDTVVSMLPEKISAVIEGAKEPEEITLTSWICEEYKQNADGNWPVQGEYTFAAALPEGYALASQTEALEIKVMLGGASPFTEETGGFTVEGGTLGADYSYENNVLTILSNSPLTISGQTSDDCIVIADGVNANITLDNVNIRLLSNAAFEVKGSASCSLTLVGENKLQSGIDKAGLQVCMGAALTITEESSGRLEASGDRCGAGIGGGFKGAGGTITISGGTVIATGGIYGAGIGGGYCGAGGTTTISGGTVMATGGTHGAGIGGGYCGAGGTITISDGIVTANGGADIGETIDITFYYGGGAGIGGGASGDGGRITILGGTVIANGKGNSAGLGGGGFAGLGDSAGGEGGIITVKGGRVTAVGGEDTYHHTSGAGIGGSNRAGGGEITIDEDSVVFATGYAGAEYIGAGSNGQGGTKTFVQGVVFQGDAGAVYGNPATLPDDLEIPLDKTLTIEKDTTLAVEDGVTLINLGTIDNRGTINNRGTIDNRGTINNYGSITPNDPTGTGIINGASTTKVTLAGEDNTAITTAVYGSIVTITATAQSKAQNMRSRRVAWNYVDFYVGTVEDGESLGTAEVRQEGDTVTATLEINIFGNAWKAGNNTITADFGGASALNLLHSIGTATLNVTRAEQTTEKVEVSSTTATYGSAAPTITVPVEENANVTYSLVTAANESAATSDVASISDRMITLNKAGTFYVKAIIDQTDHYEGKTIYSDPITVNHGASMFTVITKKGEDETDTFTYGDEINVEVSGFQVKPQTRARTVEQNYVYLFAADPGAAPDASVAIASEAVTGDSATLTYNTAGKEISIGSATLYVAYGGSDKLLSSVQPVNITLNKKALTGEVVSTTSKVYDGTNNFSGVALQVSGELAGDAVTATADGTSADPDVGTHVFTAEETHLGGADVDYYSLAARDISGSVEITKKPLNKEMVAEISEQTYTGSPIKPVLTVTDGIPNIIQESDYIVSYTNNTDVGTASVTITATEGGNYSGSARKNFCIGRSQQNVLTISGKPDGEIVYGQEFTLTTTGGSGTGAVTWTATGPATVEETTGRISITGVGEVTVTATKTGDNNYQDATATDTFTTIKADQTNFSINSVTGKKYGDAPFKLGTAGGNGDGEVSYSVPENNDVLTVSGDIASIVGTGTVTVTATKAESANYNRVTDALEITINKADALTVTYPNAGSLTYGQKLSESSLTGGDTAYGTFAWADENTVPTVINTGYPVKFTANEDILKNYNSVANPKESVTVTVSKAVPAVSVSADFSDKAGSRQAVLTASVEKTGDGILPTGTVKFVNSTGDEDEVITGADNVTITEGTAVYTWKGLASEIYKVKAVYSGDSNYEKAISSEISIDARKKGDDWPAPPVAVKIGRSDVTVTDTPYGGGISLKPGVSVTGDGKALTEGMDYEVVLSGDCVSVTEPEDTLTARLYLKNGYVPDAASWPAGTAGKDEKGEYLVLNWRIVPKNMADTTIMVQDGKILVKNDEMVVPDTEYCIKDNGDGTFTISAAQESKNYTGSQTIQAEGMARFVIRGEADRNLIRVTVEESMEGAEAYDYVLCKSEEDFEALNFFKANKNAEGTSSQFLFVRSGGYKIYARAVYRDENGRKTYSRWSEPADVAIATDTPNAPTVKKVSVKGRNVTVSYTVGARTQGVDVMLGRALRQLEQEIRPVNYNAKTGLIKNIKGSVRTVTFKNVSKGTYYAGVHPYILSKEGLKYFGRWSKQNARTKITVK